MAAMPQSRNTNIGLGTTSNIEGTYAMDTRKKLFAFKLADKQAAGVDRNNGKWKARDGVVIAGCTLSAVSPGFQIGLTSNYDTAVPC